MISPKKVLLINPPRHNELMVQNPPIIERHRGYNPPLGLLYLAANIPRDCYDVEILDCQPLEFDYVQLRQHLAQKQEPAVVGIPAMSFTLIDVKKTIDAVRKVFPNATVICGGPHIQYYPREMIEWEGVDYLLIGDAEYSFPQLLNALNGAEEFKNVSGLVHKAEGKTIVNPYHITENLDELKFPDRSLVDNRLYNSLLGSGKLITTIVSSRGCPYKCGFCARPFSEITSRFRCRSAANVVEELEECVQKYGIREFLFYDDTLTVKKDRVHEICELILERKLNIAFDVRTRIDVVDKSMLLHLKKAGCLRVHYGVEAGSDRVLKVINKGIRIDKIRSAFKATAEAEIESLAYFMLGLPTETMKDIENTMNFAVELNPDYVHATVFSPFPGTKLYDLALEKGIVKQDVWKDFAREPSPDFIPPHWNEHFSKEELIAILNKFYKKFYLRPRFIWKRIKKIQSFEELKNKIGAGISVMLLRKDSSQDN